MEGYLDINSLVVPRGSASTSNQHRSWVTEAVCLRMVGGHRRRPLGVRALPLTGWIGETAEWLLPQTNTDLAFLTGHLRSVRRSRGRWWFKVGDGVGQVGKHVYGDTGTTPYRIFFRNPSNYPPTNRPRICGPRFSWNNCGQGVWLMLPRRWGCLDGRS
jgi:hypothetical protein